MREPLAVTVPMPLSMLTVVAFVINHVSVDDWPRLMLLGDAENVPTGGKGITLFTVTVTEAELVLPLVSVAIAVSVCTPFVAAMLFHTIE